MNAVDSLSSRYAGIIAYGIGVVCLLSSSGILVISKRAEYCHRCREYPHFARDPQLTRVYRDELSTIYQVTPPGENENAP